MFVDALFSGKKKLVKQNIITENLSDTRGNTFFCEKCVVENVISEKSVFPENIVWANGCEQNTLK